MSEHSDPELRLGRSHAPATSAKKKTRTTRKRKKKTEEEDDDEEDARLSEITTRRQSLQKKLGLRPQAGGARAVTAPLVTKKQGSEGAASK